MEIHISHGKRSNKRKLVKELVSRFLSVDSHRLQCLNLVARLAQELPESVQKETKKKKVKKDPLAGLPLDKRAAVTATKELYQKWLAPMNALEKVPLQSHPFIAEIQSQAGRAFEGLEALLGGGRAGVFELQGNMWSRKGWAQMDDLRRKLENLKARPRATHQGT